MRALSLNYPKFAEICPFLFIPHACLAFLKYALIPISSNELNLGNGSTMFSKTFLGPL